MARTVRDVERLFEVMAGPDPGDPSSAPVGIRRWKDEEIHRLRVAYFEDDVSSPVTPETGAAVRKAADALREQGFEWKPGVLKILSESGNTGGIFSGGRGRCVFADAGWRGRANQSFAARFSRARGSGWPTDCE